MKNKKILQIVLKIIFFLHSLENSLKIIVKMFHLEPTPISLKVIDCASQAKLRVFYRRILIKLEKCSSHLWFITSCKNKNLTPNFINIKCLSRSPAALKATSIAKTTWLNEELKKWYATRYFLHLHFKVIHPYLAKLLHTVQFDIFDQEIREELMDFQARTLFKKI